MTLRRLVAPWRPRTTRTDDGLTLVEMVVALGIITVLLLSAGSALVALQRTQRFGEATDRATQLAADRVEQIRKVPWGKMGMNPGTPAAPTTPAFPYTSERPVQFATAGQAPAVLAGQVRDATTQVGANQFTVYTRVTWAPPPSGETNTNVNANSSRKCRNNYTGVWMGCGTDDGIEDDAAKRITIRVEWTDGNKNRTFDFSTVRYPTIAEAIPAALLTDGQTATRSTCDRPGSSGWCTLTATEGTVLVANSGTYKTTIPVTFTGVSKADLTSASAALTSGSRAPVSYALANPSGDKRTWTKTFPVGTILYPSGTGSILFTPSTGAADTLTGVAFWTDMAAQPAIVPAVGTAWTGANPGPLRADPYHSDPLVAANGSENTAQEFCTKPDGSLWNYQTLFFDVRNIDYQDGDSAEEPTVTFTGLADPARAGSAISRAALPTYVGHPAWAVTGASTTALWGTGEIGPAYSSAPPGAANSMRWYVAFPAGTKFHTATNNSVVTIAQTRPGDGVTAQTNATIPVRAVPTAADCNVVPPTAPTNLVATATGTSVTLTWTGDPYATSYKVYKAVQTNGGDPLTYTLATTTAAKTYTTTAAIGQNVTFYVVASNVHGSSNDSATASAATIPTIPPGVVDTDYGNYWGLFENTGLSQGSNWATSHRLYRSMDGGAQVLLGDGQNWGAANWSWTSPTPMATAGHNWQYYVEACNAAGCGARRAGPVERVPFWMGLFQTGGGTIFDWAPVPTAYGSTGAYDFANSYAAGTDITFNQPAAFGQPGDARSMLMNTPGNIRQFAGYVAGPGTNTARAVGFMYKESGTFSAGWLFGRAGTTVTNGFSAKNTAAGTIVMNGTTTASWTGLKINDLAWHYYIFSYDGTNVTLFEDGVNKGAKALVVNTPTTSDLTFNIADGQTPTTGVSGSYAWMNYWSKAVSASDALDLYNARMDP